MISDADLRERIWQESSSVLFMEREDYLRSLAPYRVEAVYDARGDLLGATMKLGPEFHFVIFKRGTRLMRGFMMSLIQPQLDEFGYITTRTPVDDLRQRRFNTAWGFVVTGQDALDVYYRYDARKRCQQ